VLVLSITIFDCLMMGMTQNINIFTRAYKSHVIHCDPSKKILSEIGNNQNLKKAPKVSKSKMTKLIDTNIFTVPKHINKSMN
jgi:hypothetical protein